MNTTPKRQGILGTSQSFGVAVVAIGFWTVCTLGLDVGLVRTFVAQVQALSYPTAEGVVTASKVEIDSDADGSTYMPKVEYRYTVARRELVGDRLQHHWTSFSPKEARRTVAQYPPGSGVKVYYNPRDPSNSLLQPGLDAGHAVMLLISLPFNVGMVGFWIAAWSYFRGTQGHLPWIVGAKETQEGLTLRLPDYSPLTAAAIFIAIASLVGVFIAHFAAGLLPQGLLVACVWAAVVGGAALVYLWQHLRAGLLTIDEFKSEFTLCDTLDRGPQQQGPLSELQAINVHKVTTRDDDGDETHRFSVALVQQDKSGQKRHVRLVTNWSEHLAGQLAQWLADRLHLPLMPTAEHRA